MAKSLEPGYTIKKKKLEYKIMMLGLVKLN